VTSNRIPWKSAKDAASRARNTANTVAAAACLLGLLGTLGGTNIGYRDIGARQIPWLRIMSTH
jgi:hypothetical protein